jgi:molecular chaperone GrpE (heat shock protein)
VREAARQRLEQAGIRLDGAPGEPLDLARHRVVKSRRAAVGQPTVRTVIRSGVTVGDVRVRPAEVVIDEPEER